MKRPFKYARCLCLSVLPLASDILPNLLLSFGRFLEGNNTAAERRRNRLERPTRISVAGPILTLHSISRGKNLGWINIAKSKYERMRRQLLQRVREIGGHTGSGIREAICM